MDVEITYPSWALFHALSHFESPSERYRDELLRAGYTDAQLEAQMAVVGSKFDRSFACSPQEVVDRLMERFSETFRTAPDSDGRVRLSFVWPTRVGTAGVVEESLLNDEERLSIRSERRGASPVRTFRTERSFPTDDCQLILQGAYPHFTLVSLFPGEAAPKLPVEGETPDPYWQTHLFIRDND